MSTALSADRELGRMSRSKRICWVTLGDSFTAGTSRREQPWPQLLLAGTPGGADVRLENLARMGATVGEVRAEQVPAAIAERPQIVTVICGGNDVIGSVRPRFAEIALELDELWRSLSAELPRAALVTATYPPIGPDSMRPRTRDRIERGLLDLNAIIRGAASLHRVRCVDLARHPGRHHHDNYAADGIHPSDRGHEETAAALRQTVEEGIATLEEPDNSEETG